MTCRKPLGTLRATVLSTMRAEPPPCAEAARDRLRLTPSCATHPAGFSVLPTPSPRPRGLHRRLLWLRLRTLPPPCDQESLAISCATFERERVVESEIPALPFSSCSSSFKCRSFTRAQPGCRWCLCRPLRKLHFLDLGTEQRHPERDWLPLHFHLARVAADPLPSCTLWTDLTSAQAFNLPKMTVHRINYLALILSRQRVPVIY
ncbi:hypothetical protein B0H14DRAFT_1090805 [Mycena olivaceomarginata]|nr:hypothetical protein B0H14DRAFT_1090805 [Mycena olivaceomarginata]